MDKIGISPLRSLIAFVIVLAAALWCVIASAPAAEPACTDVCQCGPDCACGLNCSCLADAQVPAVYHEEHTHQRHSDGHSHAHAHQHHAHSYRVHRPSVSIRLGPPGAYYVYPAPYYQPRPSWYVERRGILPWNSIWLYHKVE